MQLQRPHIAEEDLQSFAFCVGKAIQNYGTIEYLVNELIAVLVNDSVVSSHLVRLGISKRLELLESLVNRRADVLSKAGVAIGDLCSSAKSAFHQRNKIAHNPFVLRQQNGGSQAVINAGIHVIRYHESGKQEEWIDREKVEALAVSSRKTGEQFNVLLSLLKSH